MLLFVTRSPGLAPRQGGALPGSPCLVSATRLTYRKNAVEFDSLAEAPSRVLHKFQAQIMLSPSVTMLHTLTCPVCSAAGDPLRVVRARNVTEAVLDLIAVYMSDGVRRNVSVCSCTKGGEL